MFLAIVSYILGFAMETFIPRYGLFRYLNPVSFNHSHTTHLSYPFPASFQQKRECFHHYHG
jgi:hypothetical protein